MATEDSYTYVWIIGQKAYVWWDDVKGPERVWAVRDDYDSELNDWLTLLDEKPKLDRRSLLFATYGNRCRATVRLIRKQLIRDGYELLSSRDRATVKAGHQRRRPVYSPKGWHRSVSAAARAWRIDKSAVTLKCQAGKDGWRYDVPQ